MLSIEGIAQPNGVAVQPVREFITGFNIYAPDFVYDPSGPYWRVFYGGFLNDGDDEDSIYLSHTNTLDLESGFSLHNLRVVSPGVFQHVNDPSVVRLSDNDWVMAFTGAHFDSDGCTNEDLWFAKSSDGIGWVPAEGTDQTRIVFELPPELGLGIADLAFTGRPSIVWDSIRQRFLLYFDARSCSGIGNCTWRFLVAESTAMPTVGQPWLFRVLKQLGSQPPHGEPIEREHWLQPDVEMVNGRFMAVTDHNDGNLYLWESFDGVGWHAARPLAGQATRWPLEIEHAGVRHYLHATDDTRIIDNAGLMVARSPGNEQLVGIGFGITWDPSMEGHQVLAGYTQYRFEAQQCPGGEGAPWYRSGWGASNNEQFGNADLYTADATTFCRLRIVNPINDETLAERIYPTTLTQPTTLGDHWIFEPDGQLIDSDADGYPASEDCSDSDWTFYPGAPDNCFDGLLKNCNDADQDDISDSCDPYPCDHLNDGDADGHGACDPGYGGLCASGYCETHPGDNCPAVLNASQDNCNLLSELAHDELVLGDACDPVPCPDALAIERAEVIMSINTHGIRQEVVRLYSNEVGLLPLASHSMSAQGEQSFVEVDNVPTAARFCQDDRDLLQVACTHRSNLRDLYGRESLCAPGEPDPSGKCIDLEIKSSPYHRISFPRQDGGSSEGNGANPNGDPALVDYARAAESTAPDFVTGDGWLWDYVSDYDRWIEDQLINVPEDVPAFGSEASGLRGALWLHAETLVGSSQHGLELANHYMIGYQPERIRQTGSCAITAIQDPFFLQLTLPDPPYDPLRDTFVRDFFERWDGQPGETSVIVSLGERGWGAIDLQGRAELVTDRLGVALQASLRDSSLQWASTVEPFLS